MNAVSADWPGAKFEQQDGFAFGEPQSEIQNTATEINRLTEKLAKLNQRIVQMEGGRTVGSDAVGLRDERLQVLNELAANVDIRAGEQPSGSVTVYVGGEYLVADGIHRRSRMQFVRTAIDRIPKCDWLIPIHRYKSVRSLAWLIRCPRRRGGSRFL